MSPSLTYGPRAGLVLWGLVAAILLLPTVAMQFTSQVAWNAYDFAFAAVLLGGAALAWEAAHRVVRRPLRRAAVAASLLALVLLVWAEGAVGIF